MGIKHICALTTPALGLQKSACYCWSGNEFATNFWGDKLCMIIMLLCRSHNTQILFVSMRSPFSLNRSTKETNVIFWGPWTNLSWLRSWCCGSCYYLTIITRYLLLY